MPLGRSLAATLAVLALSGCAAVGGAGASRPNAPSGPSASDGATSVPLDDSDVMPAPDPAFARHFTDPVYDDAGGEFAPFGTDEGADLLAEWSLRRDQLSDDTTVADLVDALYGFDEVVEALGTPEGPGVPVPAGQVDAATIIIGAGFTLLRLTGQIDDEGRRLTLTALDVLVERYGAPAELVRQRDDLLSWPN